jgi:transcriptional regulator GlxA family with amidase domain
MHHQDRDVDGLQAVEELGFGAFLRRFIKATGMKLSEYQQRLRITRAKEMLEFSRTSVDEITSAVGCDSARFVGCSARSWG